MSSGLEGGGRRILSNGLKSCSPFFFLSDVARCFCVVCAHLIECRRMPSRPVRSAFCSSAFTGAYCVLLLLLPAAEPRDVCRDTA